MVRKKSYTDELDEQIEKSDVEKEKNKNNIDLSSNN